MRPNLSIEKITAALAVLGATALVGCGGGDQKPAVNANEVAPAGDKKADGAGHCGSDAKHDQGQAGCGANKGAGSCGANGQGSCGASAKGPTGDSAKPTDTGAAGGSGSSATPDTKAATDTTKGAAATPAPSASGTTTAPAKKAPPPPPAKKGGASGCGAGTCGTKK